MISGTAILLTLLSLYTSQTIDGESIVTNYSLETCPCEYNVEAITNFHTTVPADLQYVFLWVTIEGSTNYTSFVSSEYRGYYFLSHNLWLPFWDRGEIIWVLSDHEARQGSASLYDRKIADGTTPRCTGR